MLKFFEGLLELLFPVRCRICKKPSKEVICSHCIESFPKVTGYICKKCGKPCVREFNVCNECRGKRLHFTSARSGGIYSGSLKEAIHQLKYKNGKILAPYLAEFASSSVADVMDGVDVIAYVPLTKKKEAKRGYNQAELIARALSSYYDKPIYNGLIKVKDIPEQNKLGLTERSKNVSGAFEAYSPVSGNILLVDDVYTTGSTVNECAKVLERSGASEILVLTIARTALAGN